MPAPAWTSRCRLGGGPVGVRAKRASSAALHHSSRGDYRRGSHAANDQDGSVRHPAEPALVRCVRVAAQARPARATLGAERRNGEPMETAGEVIANVGLIMEHLDREVR